MSSVVVKAGELGRTVKRIFRIISAYSLWVISGALSFWILLWARIFILIDLPVMLGVSPWAMGAIDKSGIVILGLIWLGFVVASEPFFRQLYTKRMAFINVLKIFIIEGLLLVAFYGGHRLFLR